MKYFVYLYPIVPECHSTNSTDSSEYDGSDTQMIDSFPKPERTGRASDDIQDFWLAQKPTVLKSTKVRQLYDFFALMA